MFVTGAALIANLQADPVHALYHAGKFMSLLGVFMKDMLHLRLLTLVGTVCSLAYFFTRRPVIWGAIFWGTIFGLANLNMVFRLVLERMGGLRLSADDRRIYKRHFSQSSVTLQQFEGLLTRAERVRVPAGARLREPKGQHRDLMLLLEGQVAVSWGEDSQVKRVLDVGSSSSWLGEMGFLLRWSHEGRLPSYSHCIASLVARTPCQLLIWSDDEMRKLLNADVELRRSMLLLLGDARFQRLFDRSRSDEYASMLAGILKDGTLASQDRRMANVFRQKHSISPWKHEWHINLLGWTIQDWSRGSVDAPGMKDQVASEAIASGPPRPRGVIVFNDYSPSNSELGPFYLSSVTDDNGVVWPSLQHYVAVHRHSPALEEEIRAAPDAHTLRALLREARFAESVREDWTSARDAVMLRATRWKFAQNRRCAEILARTGDCDLMFNHPNNDYWGCGDDGQGENRMGEVLQQVRGEMQSRRRAARPRRGLRRLLG